MYRNLATYGDPAFSVFLLGQAQRELVGALGAVVKNDLNFFLEK